MALGLYGQPGLLGDGQNPLAGLLQQAALPGQPANQMAQNLMAIPGMSGQMPTPQAPTPQLQGAAPSPAPAQQVAAPAPAGSPSAATSNALMAGGIAAMRAARPEGGGTLGAALGEGLAQGSLAFTATKKQEADLKAQQAKQAAYEQYVRALPGLTPDAKVGLIQMGYAEGGKMLAENGLKVPEPKVVGDSLVDPRTGREIYRAPEKAPTPRAPAEDLDVSFRTAMAVHGLEPNMSVAERNAVFEKNPALRDSILAEAHTYRRSGAAGGTNVTLNPAFEIGAEKTGELAISGRMRRREELENTLMPDLTTIGEMKSLLGKGIFTGPLAESRAKVAAFLGSAEGRRTLQYIQGVNARVLPIARSLAPVTETDVALLQRIKGGDLNLTEKELARLVQLDELAWQYRAARHNTESIRSPVMNNETNRVLIPETTITMPDGSVPVMVGRNVAIAEYDPDLGVYVYKDPATGKYKEYR